MINLIDYIISILIFLITLPLTLISWILIFFLEESPIIYKSDRIGYKKNPFIVYKFRTMSTSNSSGVTLANDSRVTRLGLILRKFKMFSDLLPDLQ